MQVHIRWMIRRDMAEVFEIENSSYFESWNEEDFLKALRERNTIGMVCEVGEKVVGFMVYELHKKKLHVVKMAVHPDYRRQGVGRKMLDKLRSKLRKGLRTRISFDIPDTNDYLGGHLFMKVNGIGAVGVQDGMIRFVDRMSVEAMAA